MGVSCPPAGGCSAHLASTHPAMEITPPKNPKSPFPVLLEVVHAPRRAVTEGCHSTAATYWHLQLVQLHPALKTTLITMKESRSVNTSSAYLFACSGSENTILGAGRASRPRTGAVAVASGTGAAPDWREGDRVTSTVLKKINLPRSSKPKAAAVSLLYFPKVPRNR